MSLIGKPPRDLIVTRVPEDFKRWLQNFENYLEVVEIIRPNCIMKKIATNNDPTLYVSTLFACIHRLLYRIRDSSYNRYRVPLVTYDTGGRNPRIKAMNSAQ